MVLEPVKVESWVVLFLIFSEHVALWDPSFMERGLLLDSPHRQTLDLAYFSLASGGI